MKSKIVDALVGLLLLISSLESLQQYSNLRFLSVLFAVFYFVSGFAVLRAYSWAKYILYANSATLLLITVIGLYLTNFEAWYIGVIPFVLAIIFGAYGYYRYRGPSVNKPFKREALIFAVSLIAFSILSVTIDHLFWSTGNIEMGVFRLE